MSADRDAATAASGSAGAEGAAGCRCECNAQAAPGIVGLVIVGHTAVSVATRHCSLAGQAGASGVRAGPDFYDWVLYTAAGLDRVSVDCVCETDSCLCQARRAETPESVQVVVDRSARGCVGRGRAYPSCADFALAAAGPGRCNHRRLCQRGRHAVRRSARTSACTLRALVASFAEGKRLDARHLPSCPHDPCARALLDCRT